MTLTVEATYENGVLKVREPLPLKEQETVEVTVRTRRSVVDETAGILPWRGDVDTLHRIAEDDEFGILESP